MANSKSKSRELLKFVESIVFMILIIVTIIANTYGSIYLKLIPLLFLLGIVGRLVYSRPVITSIFGGAFSIITMYINGTYSINEILISSLTNTVLILCGEIFAICLITCITDFKKKKNNNIKLKNGLISILFFVLSIYITLYFNGNIFRYENTKDKLEKYLKENYSDIYFYAEGYRYVPFKDRGYSFKVKNVDNNATYKFIVYEDDEMKIYDGYEINIIKNKNANITEYLNKNIYSEYFKVTAEYSTQDSLDILIRYVAQDINYKDNLIKDVIDINSKLLEYDASKDISEIKVIVEDTSENKLNVVYFKFKDYCKQIQEQGEEEYLNNVFDVEFFDF